MKSVRVYRVHWESTGSLLGVYWESTGSEPGVYKEHTGSPLGVYWESTGRTLGLYWEYTGSPLGVNRESTRSILGVHWEYTGSPHTLEPIVITSHHKAKFGGKIWESTRSLYIFYIQLVNFIHISYTRHSYNQVHIHNSLFISINVNPNIMIIIMSTMKT